MHLDSDDEQVLNGEFGETRQKMMEILVALGKVFGAERLVPVVSAQVSGASYKTIGKWGLEWLRSLDARVVVPTVLNPVGMPRERWHEFNIPQEFAAQQEEILQQYRRLGVKLECTCTPYHLYALEFGDHIAWAESSAVVYANSVIGARTNREGGPSALAAAIIGKTPFYGLHRVENRRPQVVVEPEEGIPAEHYGALGYVAGKYIGNRVPYFRKIRPTRAQMKALGAGMAATGAVALFHVEGITPDARIFSYTTEGLEHITIPSAEIRDLFSRASPDAVAVGCPHCAAPDLERIATLLEGKKVTRPFFIFSARGVMRTVPGAVAAIERSGAKVFADTCMVVSPGMEGYRTIMVDSGKALAYVPDMCGAVARLGTLEECIAEATK
jgi:predicted aconitase